MSYISYMKVKVKVPAATKEKDAGTMAPRTCRPAALGCRRPLENHTMHSMNKSTYVAATTLVKGTSHPP